MPQIGAVLVPINYRLTADDFAYIINHSGATVVCAHADYLAGRRRHPRASCQTVAHFVALDGAAAGRAGSSTRSSLAAASRRRSTRPAIDERDLLTINYTSGTTSRPKGVMITHRNAYMNVVGTLVHMPMTCARSLPVDAADVPRQRLDVHLDVTAVGGAHVCLPKVDPPRVFELDRATSGSRMLCAAPTVLIALANAPDERAAQGAARRPRGHRRRAAGRGDHRAHRRRARLDDHAGLRADRNGAVHHRLRAAARARRAVAGRARDASRRGRASS